MSTLALVFARILSLLSILLSTTPVFAAEWSWTWNATPGDKTPTADICALKYGKRWVYTVEIDDGPKWVRSFAAPFLAQYHYTDAPPGVPGGVRKPFVGAVAVIVGAIGNSDAVLDWKDLNALTESGWGVMNHSFDHRANDWSGESARLTDFEVRADAFWSQAILTAKLPGGRAPTGAVYANGYTDYNRHGALAAYGIGIATRVGGSSPRDVLSPQMQWMDFPRSYLDEKVWANEWNKSKPMADFPGADQDGPPANSLVIDFTHEIERKPDSANLARWRTRLETIERRWGAGGDDTLWSAPTAEVADYALAAKTAKLTVAAGKLTVSIPDQVPGSALTLRLSGISTEANLHAPEGGTLYREGTDFVLTTPRIGLRAAPSPTPRLKCIYEGPAVSVDFPQPVGVAGVTLRVFGNPSSALPYRLAVRTAKGEVEFANGTVGPGWVARGHLCPILPNSPAIIGSGIAVVAPEPFKAMAVWAVEDNNAFPASGNRAGKRNSCENIQGFADKRPKRRRVNREQRS